MSNTEREENIFDIFNLFDMCSSNFIFFLSNKINFCITSIGTDGIWYGYSPSFGTSSQSSALKPILYYCNVLFNCSVPLKCNELSLIIYTLIWNTNGDFIIKIGVNGDEKYNDSDILIVDNNIANWNNLEKYYEFSNQNLADDLMTLTEKCFYITTP